MHTAAFRTAVLFRKHGWVCQKVERWDPYSRRRVDLFGFADLVCLHPEHGIAGVQCTTHYGRSAHLRKMREDCFDAIVLWTRSGGLVLLASWRKRRYRWEPRVEVLVPRDGTLVPEPFVL